MLQASLPIYAIADALVAACATESRLLLTAPTGSGKSTQVPQILLDRGVLGDGEVVVLQPRRLAARLLAARVAEERGCALGSEVGYQVRLEGKTSPATRIRYVTEGILLRRLLTSPHLDGVAAILFDEFHERHVYGDITLARARMLQETARPALKLIVMSATLDTGVVQPYLAPCPVLSTTGRLYPVAVEYLPRPVDAKRQPIWDTAATAFDQLVRAGVDGDVLVFMPGAYEIMRTIDAISDLYGPRLELPLHGELPPAEQDRPCVRLGPQGRRCHQRAETSITIDVRAVIDSGLARVARFDPHRGINTLYIEPISQAVADQRAGRPGHGAWALSAPVDGLEHRGRAACSAEIRRIDLAEILIWKAQALLICDVSWLEAPAEPASSVPATVARSRAADRHRTDYGVGQRMVSPDAATPCACRGQPYLRLYP